MAERLEGAGPKVYICRLCSWAYDEAASGVRFDDLPDEFACAICGAGKDAFEES
ncbi:MAG: rubredoxin [Nitrospirae bacterium]|nr:rubredoxin [Nitrospirota bacterium]